MLQVVCGAAVSAAMILFAVGLIGVEFRRRWAQVIAALEMPDTAVSLDPVPPLALRPVRVVSSRRPRVRQPAPAYRLAA